MSEVYETVHLNFSLKLHIDDSLSFLC